MSEMQTSLDKVEKIREQLHIVVKDRALTDPEVVVVSQQLDQALNEYRYISSLVQPGGNKLRNNNKP